MFVKKRLPFRYWLGRRFNWFVTGLAEIITGIVCVMTLTLWRPDLAGRTHEHNLRYDLRLSREGRWKVV